LVVGEKEQKHGTVDIRSRDQKETIGSKRVDETAEFFRSLLPQKSSQYEDLY